MVRPSTPLYGCDHHGDTFPARASHWCITLVVNESWQAHLLRRLLLTASQPPRLPILDPFALRSLLCAVLAWRKVYVYPVLQPAGRPARFAANPAGICCTRPAPPPHAAQTLSFTPHMLAVRHGAGLEMTAGVRINHRPCLFFSCPDRPPSSTQTVLPQGRRPPGGSASARPAGRAGTCPTSSCLHRRPGGSSIPHPPDGGVLPRWMPRVGRPGGPSSRWTSRSVVCVCVPSPACILPWGG